ncbi:MAG: 16S rRNA (cytosine(1402)-N(4))-methyltransferase RsmH [Planctomycetes bacterium]|nr:16S rRNA (cytosine(1402)-N(4))-methyltransferase RsmH [Planctomycetota bacterium]
MSRPVRPPGNPIRLKPTPRAPDPPLIAAAEGDSAATPALGGHVPVLAAEVLRLLAPKPGEAFIDATVGAGGHAALILRATAPDGRLLGLDRDAEALAVARRRLAEFGARVTLAHGEFRDVAIRAREFLGGEEGSGAARPGVDGVLADLGVSSLQLDAPERGFSFRAEGPIDMRMDRSRGPTAGEVIAAMAERDLADAIHDLSDERHARRIARSLKAAVSAKALKSTRDLADLIVRATGYAHGRAHAATRTFQALRMLVNDETGNLALFLDAAPGLLRAGGRLAVIAFHSGEDRVVKAAFRRLTEPGAGFDALTRKPVRPTTEETTANPRARGARLRTIVRREAEDGETPAAEEW